MKHILILFLLSITSNLRAQSLNIEEQYSRFNKYTHGFGEFMIIPFKLKYEDDTVIYLSYKHLWVIKNFFHKKGMGENEIINLLFESIYLEKPIIINKYDSLEQELSLKYIAFNDCKLLKENIDIESYRISDDISVIQQMYDQKDPKLSCLLYFLFIENIKIAGILVEGEGMRLGKVIDLPDNIDPDTLQPIE